MREGILRAMQVEKRFGDSEYTFYLCCIMKIRVLAFTGQDSYFFTLFVLQGSPAAKGNTGGFWMWDGHHRMPNVSSTGPMFGIFRSVMKFKYVGLV